MQTDIPAPGGAPTRPLRADPRHPAKLDAQGHIRGVEATSSGLIRATLGSALAAGAILVFAWLPAEYGIDPTGVGSVLGLTEMGEIKQQLSAEAEADEAAAAGAPPAPAAVPASTDPAIAERLASIEAQLAAIAAVVGATGVAAPAPAPAPEAAPPVAEAPAAPPVQAAGWRDEVSYTLAPTEGIEIKLVMEEGAVAAFEWTANGGVLNYDTHGDGGGQSISYEQGRAVPEQSGELTAAFTGNHGWFWRNRTGAPVTMTLRTRGDYVELRAP
jgi:hypothetical protein